MTQIPHPSGNPVCLALFTILFHTLAHPAFAAGDSLQWVTTRIGTTAIVYTESDRSLLPSLEKTILQSQREIAEFFHCDFPLPVIVRIFPDRTSLTAYWRAAWHDPGFQAQCWMVASGTGSTLALLSPRAWREEACDHDPRDSASTSRLITHELVHVFQGQHNRHPELDSLDDLAWFVEGVATYASGQLEHTHAGRVREAVSKDMLPSALKDVWTGPYRYGLAASLVQFIDTTHGRATTTSMLAGTSETELLRLLGTTEQELLSRWKTWLRTSR